ncbi:MAG: hypothetical protein NUV78_00885 [Candidatus Zambryskibacteria bacterium]|nr:hypothetical protein [Candidatus Zambryskibacteria bacterium]
MTSMRANFGDLLEPGLRKLFDDRYNEIPEVFSSIFHVATSSVDVERDSAVTGFGLLTQTAEGAPITYEDPVNIIAAFGRNANRKFLKLRERLDLTIEKIRSQTQKWGGSETIIGASFGMVG